MGAFNADFWEIPLAREHIEAIPADKALWFETKEDRERRQALTDFFEAVLPSVEELIHQHLTDRQREVLLLYYFYGKTQEDIAAMLALSQSTVSRHLFGTVRNGRRVGGALPKLRKVLARTPPAPVEQALNRLDTQFARAV